MRDASPLPKLLNVPRESDFSALTPHVLDDWYIVCRSRKLKHKPYSTTLFDTPLVLFRDSSGNAHALLDRCPHRNVPLSQGRVLVDRIECPYHGWQINSDGNCVHIPCRFERKPQSGYRVPSFAVCESDGFVWVYPMADSVPMTQPYRFRYMGQHGYTTISQELSVEATLHATLENALDVPHTAYLHGGLFRSKKKTPNELDVVIRRWHDRVEAEYIGEPRPKGLVGRFLSPKGGMVSHFDRFILPSIGEVEYRLDDNHIVVAGALTPVNDWVTRIFAVVSFKLRIPGWLIRPFFKPLALMIFRQDQRILERQTALLRTFSHAAYLSTEIDVLGPHILKLMRRAARRERTPLAEPWTRTLKMLT